MEVSLFQDPSIAYLSRLIRRKGPSPAHYLPLDLHLEQIQCLLQSGLSSAAQWPLLKRELFAGLGDHRSLLHALQAFGQAEISPAHLTYFVLAAQSPTTAGNGAANVPKEVRQWNNYLLQTPVFQAWRNRATRLRRLVQAGLQTRETFRLLYLNCGCGMDVLQLYQDLDPWRLETLVIEPSDADRGVLTWLCSPYSDDLRISNGSDGALRRIRGVDLIWAPWFLEWHNPVLVQERLRPLLPLLRPGGSMVLHHLQRDAPSQAALDVLGRPGYSPPELSETTSMMQLLLGAERGLSLQVRRSGSDWILVGRRDKI